MKLKVDLTCPGCGRKLTELVENMHPGRKTTCPSCQATIAWRGDDGRKTQRALDDLKRAIKRIGKRR